MEQSELLRSGVHVFERLNVPYFVTGSMATISCGEPRMTSTPALMRKQEWTDYWTAFGYTPAACCRPSAM